ncbi:MAG: hypothetical protein AAFR87_33480 [Bacteroidota bacterium]
MDKLATILNSLSSDEQKEFIQFLQRQKKKKNRKDLELCQYLIENGNEKDKDLLEKLYPESLNMPAYHALRKRLNKQLISFVSLKRTEHDPTSASSVMGLISLSHYLFGKNLDRLAWEYSKKAERIAAKHEQYELLNNIYNLQIEHAESEYADDLESIIEKKEQNRSVADEEERAKIAYAIINKRLKELKLSAEEKNIYGLIEETLARSGLSQALNKNPRLLYRFMFITRKAILAQKDFHAFEPYVIGMYQNLSSNEGFSSQHHVYKIRLLYMIAHVLYRNKKFESSISYLELMHEAMLEYKGAYRNRFYPKYAMLLSANYMFINESEKGVSLLDDLIYNADFQINLADKLNSLFSLAVFYFLREEYDKTVRCNLDVYQSDKWLDKKMGREWTMKKLLCEALLQVHLKNYDLALNKVAYIEQNYRDLFNIDQYKKVPVYINLVKTLISQPDKEAQLEFYQKARASFNFRPMEEEDLQEVIFYGWLKSYLTGQKYYEVLLELVGRVKVAHEEFIS